MGITRSHLGDYEGSMNNVHKLTLNHELPQLTDLRILKVSRSGVQAEGSGPGPPSPCLWTKDINGRSLVESAAWHLGSLPTSPHTLRAEKLVSLSPRPCPAPAVTLPLCTGGRRRGCLELRREVRAASLGCSWDGRQEAWRRLHQQGRHTSPGPKDMFQLWIRRQAAGGPGLSTYPLWLLDDSDLKSDLPASLGLYDNIFTIAKTPRVVGAPWF